MLKKMICFSIVAVILISMGLTSMANGINYSDIRLTKTKTGGIYSGSPVTDMVVEGKNGSSWEVIANNSENLVFKSLSPILNVTPLGKVSGKTCGSGTVIVAYTNPDGTVLTDKLQMMYSKYGGNDIFTTFESHAQKTDVQARSGTYSALSSSSAVEFYIANVGRTSVAELWFYDNMLTTSGGVKSNNNATGTKEWYVEVGVDSVTSSDSYYYKDETVSATQKNISQIKRSEGWHQVVIDPTTFNKVKVYLDGEVIYTKDVVTTLASNIQYLMRGLATKTGDVMYYDDFNVYKSTEGCPVIYNAKIESAVCGQALRNKDLVVTYDIFVPCYQIEKVEAYWKNAAWNWNSGWLTIENTRGVLPVASQGVTVTDIIVRVRASSTATSADYKTSAEFVSSDITLVQPNNAINKELLFFGKNGTMYKDITEASLLGEKTVMARYRVLNTTSQPYQSTLIGALSSNDALKDIQMADVLVNATSQGQTDIELNLVDSTKDEISIYNWGNLDTMKPFGTKSTFDYIGIQ